PHLGQNTLSSSKPRDTWGIVRVREEPIRDGPVALVPFAHEQARRDTNRNTLTAVPVAKTRKGPSRSACAVSKPSASNGASKEDVKKLRLLPAANRDKRWSVRTCRVLPPSRRESPRDRPRVLGFGYSEITDQWLVSPLLGSTAGKPSPITSVAMFVLRSA